MYVVKLKLLSDWVFLTEFSIVPKELKSGIRSEEPIVLTITKKFILTDFSSVLHFYIPWKRQETFDFSDVFSGYENGTLG